MIPFFFPFHAWSLLVEDFFYDLFSSGFSVTVGRMDMYEFVYGATAVADRIYINTGVDMNITWTGPVTMFHDGTNPNIGAADNDRMHLLDWNG